MPKFTELHDLPITIVIGVSSSGARPLLLSIALSPRRHLSSLRPCCGRAGAPAGMMFLLLVAMIEAVAAVDPCMPNPCERGTCGKATARYSLAQYACDCPIGWAGLHCEVRALVAPAFSSNMVLQAGTAKATIYGNANATSPGDNVTVAVSPASAAPGGPFTATASASGAWAVTLGKLAPSAEPLTLTVTSKAGGAASAQVLTQVLRGDVYICSGQSNMALPVSGGSLPLLPNETEAMARNNPHIRLLNNGHFWPPTPSRPGETALGKQTGDAPGWALPSFGNGSTASPGTVANFSAACWFMGVTLSDYSKGTVPIGLISTDAGGTSIHRWISQKAAAKCSQVTPTSPQSMGADIGTLFEPMVLPLAQMAVSGFTWYQGEANECPKVEPVRMAGPCGGEYYACQLRAMIEDWRLTFVNSPPDAPFLVNELGAMQDAEWPVMRQAFHQAVEGLARAAVVANSDMGATGGRMRNGLPLGAMHSGRKVNLGRRNGLAMLGLQRRPLSKTFAPYYSGPQLETATITKVGASYEVKVTFESASAEGLHFSGAACCTICCVTRNGSAIQLQVANASDRTGFTWERTEPPTVAGNVVTASFTPDSPGAAVSLDLLRFMYTGEPECVLYNGVSRPSFVQIPLRI
jgi:hypothetical protein